MLMGELRDYRAEIDSIEARARTLPRWWSRLYYRWRCWQLRRDLDRWQDATIQRILSFEADNPAPGRTFVYLGETWQVVARPDWSDHHWLVRSNLNRCEACFPDSTVRALIARVEEGQS